MWKPKLQLNFFTRNLLCRAFFVALFFGSVVAPAKADLTQQQMSAAFLDALMRWGQNTSGYAGFPVVVPVNMDGWADLAYYLDSEDGPVGVLVRDITGMLAGENPMFRDWLSTLVPSNRLTEISVQLDELPRIKGMLESLYYVDQSMQSDVATIMWRLHNLTYTTNLEVRVHDEQFVDVLQYLSELDGTLSQISTKMDVFNHYDGGANISSNIYEIGDILIANGSNEWNQVSETEVEQTIDDAEDDYQDNVDDALDDYDDIPLPTGSESDPDAVNPTGPEADDLFKNLDTDVTHVPLLQLVDEPSSTRSTANDPIPGIEVDFGRMAPFELFCNRLNDLTDWLYPILGTLFLSVKGLRMWRLVKQASVFASASGQLPNMHLAWDPF